MKCKCLYRLLLIILVRFFFFWLCFCLSLFICFFCFLSFLSKPSAWLLFLFRKDRHILCKKFIKTVSNAGDIATACDENAEHAAMVKSFAEQMFRSDKLVMLFPRENICVAYDCP